jgi:hypothetical protein
MNTYRIYEDFKVTLGDAAAKSLAQTLGTMFEELKDTVTKEDFRILRESIDANVSRLDGALTRLADGQTKLFEAQTRTDAKMAEIVDGQAKLFEAQAHTDLKMVELIDGQTKLFEAQTRTDAKMAELVDGQAKLFESQARTDVKMAELADGQAKLFEAQGRTEAKMVELAEAQGRTEARMVELAEAQGRTEQQIKTLADAMQRLTVRTDAVVGHTFELRFRDRLTAYLGRFLRRGKVVGNDTFFDALESRVTTEEIDDFLRADIVAKGLVDGAEAYVVVEVSSTGDTNDVVRAERRAAILRKAGLNAIPLVACGAILPEALDFAHRSGVHVWCNGSIVDAAA